MHCQHIEHWNLKKMKMWSYWMKWYVYDFLNIAYSEYIGKESTKTTIGRYLHEKSHEWLMLLLKKKSSSGMIFFTPAIVLVLVCNAPI